VQGRRVGVSWSLVLYGAEPYGIETRKKGGIEKRADPLVKEYGELLRNG